MVYLAIAIRNIAKNLRKNALTVLMISFGIVALSLYGGSNAHMFRQFRDSVIKTQFGNFRIHAKGFSEHGRKSPYAYLIERYSAIEQELLRNDDIDYVAPRLSFAGIVASDERSAVIRGFGGRAEAETRMEYGKVSSGSFFDSNPHEETSRAILGENALRKVGAPIGDSVTVLVTMKGGGASAGDFLITGVKKAFGQDDILNGMLMVADLSGVQNLVGADDSVDTVIVHLKEGRDAKKAEGNLAEFCAKHDLEWRRWDELAVFYARSREVFAMNERILTAILLVISVFVIVNTLYMTYMERVREIGAMRAIGATRSYVARIAMCESAILAIIGCTAGVIIAAVISLLINATGGIYHPASVFNEEPFHTLIQPEPSAILSYYALFVGVSIIASLIISIRASRISIADSLRWN